MSGLKDRAQARLDGWMIEYYGYSLFEVVGIAISGTSGLLSMAALASYKWLAKDLSLSGTLDGGLITFGLIGYCADMPPQYKTKFVELRTCSTFVDWPSDRWIWASLFIGVAGIFGVTSSIAGIIGGFLIRSAAPFSALCAAFSGLCTLVSILLFLSGPGEQFGVVGIGSLEICFQGGPFDLGTDCYLMPWFFVAIGCCILAFLAAGAFVFADWLSLYTPTKDLQLDDLEGVDDDEEDDDPITAHDLAEKKD